jgi:hypothetical protein
MRFFTIDTQEHQFIELLDVNGTYGVYLTQGGEPISGIPLSPFFDEGARVLNRRHIREGLIQQTDHGAVITVNKDTRKHWQRRVPDMPAVILVKSPPGQFTELTQSVFEEYVENDRVQRRYHELMIGGEPPPGIDMLDQTPPGSPEPQYLLQLIPNAAFRIVHRESAIGKELGMLSVRWSGHDLVVKPFRPFGNPSSQLLRAVAAAS